MMTLKLCEHCGGEFEPRRANTKFCSKECRNRADYERNKDAYDTRAKAQRESDPEGAAAYHAARYERLKQDPAFMDARRAYGARHYVANREA
jgi:hypothetical protein